MFRATRPCRVVFDGQSHVVAPGDFWTGDSTYGWSWPRILMAGRELPGYVVGTGGTSMTTLASNFATRAAPYLNTSEPSIYVLCGGTQDYLDGDTGAQVYSDAGTLAGLARTAGADYVICTTTLPAVSFNGAQDSARVAGNGLIVADASDHFDATVDIDVEGLDDPNDLESYTFDGVHIWGYPVSYGGYGLKGTPRAASLVAPALDTAIDAVT